MSSSMIYCLPSPLYKPGFTVEQVLENLQKNLPQDPRAIAVPGSQIEGYSPIFENRLAIAAGGIVDVLHPNLTTLYELYEYCFIKFAHQDYCATHYNYDSKKYEYLTFKQVADLKDKVGSGMLYLLQQHGIVKSQEIIITYYFPNRYEYILIECACHAYSLVNTAIYDTLGQESFKHIFSLTNSPIIFTTKKNLHKIFINNLNGLRIVICLDKLDSVEDFEVFLLAKKHGLSLYDFETLVRIGSKHLFQHIPPKLTDTAYIAFTSGTTSLPKGCVLTHKNNLTQLISFYGTAKSKGGNSFALLPLAHCFEKMILFVNSLVGSKIHFPENPSDPKTFSSDIKKIKPNNLVVVPTILNKIEMSLKINFKNSTLLSNIINSKIKYLMNGETPPNHFIFDKIIRPRIKEKLGFSKLTSIISASAPLSKETICYLMAIFDIPIHQGYGLSETSPTITCSGPSPLSIGSVGGGMCFNELKLKDVPEMNYIFDENKSGEILIRGTNLIGTYFKQKDTFLESCEDGWFNTGDIAKLDKDNRIFIIDRIKNFFKLSQGKFIASEKITSIYLSNCPMIENLFLYGSSIQSFVIGIIGLNQELFTKFAEESSLPKDLSTINNSLLLKKKFLNHLNNQVNNDLKSYELLKNVNFKFNNFEKILTPTMKIKRTMAKLIFEKELNDLYNEGNLFKLANL